MALWVVRAGKQGEHERKFLEDSRIWLTWDRVENDLTGLPTREAVTSLMAQLYPESDHYVHLNYGAQIFSFLHRIKPDDWVVLPSKFATTLHFARVMGEAEYDSSSHHPYWHFRAVEWFATDVPKTVIDQDLRYSIGAIQTVFQISRNDAENRIRALSAKGWPVQTKVSPLIDPDPEPDQLDFESLSREEIATLIIRKFKGHGLADVVAGILRAQGYQVLTTPPGADKGVDILASPGKLGFDQPRICVQVKSGNEPADSDTLMKLKGSMAHVGATHGLLVSWSGFKSSVKGDTERKEFFNVRLWGQDDLVRNLLAEYENLDADLRAEVPLKRIWTLARGEEQDR